MDVPVPQVTERRITIDDMVDVIATEADRIRSSQVALIKAELRVEADAQKIWEAEVLETAVRFLQLAKPHMPAIRSLVAGRKR